MFKRGLPVDSPWRRLQKAQWQMLFLFVGFLPACVALSSVVVRLVGSDAPIGALLLIWMGAFLYVSFKAGYFRCPRCGERYFHKWWFHNSFARRCVHCGLPLWADPEHG
jgi:hypothetical protein